MKLSGFKSILSVLPGLVLLVYGCSSKKETVASVGMQNLTARYNIIYNAKLLIHQSETKIEEAWIDDYEQILSVYKEPGVVASGAEVKILDSAITKTDFVISEKNKSNYVGEAYFLKGKSNYLKRNFFNASEFFTYVFDTYKNQKKKELSQAALAWKARAQLQLNNLTETAVVLDSAFAHLNSEKKSVADLYAAAAQLCIRANKPIEAIDALKNAVKFSKKKSLQLRWTYILAQLQERNNMLPDAYANYTKIIKSNAPFEMAFNANLNRVYIEEQQNASVADRIERLTQLLKDYKNKDFADQIHYRIARIYEDRGDLENAIKSYTTSVRQSTKNQNQKGLSYLRIAEIYFAHANYQQAKTYYDSTLTALAPTYPAYDNIRLKSSNLDVLAKNYSTISREDTLQALAGLPKEQLERRLDALVNAQLQQAAKTGTTTAAVGAGKFYFDNTTAMSQGIVAFKQRWGNRRLEDNWRRSIKSMGEVSPALSNMNAAPSIPVIANATNDQDSVVLRKQYLESLPVTIEQMEVSHRKIIDAYYEIANFYKDVLKDEPEAIRTYEEILKRYPENYLKAEISYNLYRLYAVSNPAKSNEYRDILLKQYPQTPFAQIILDPDYVRKADAKAAALTEAYDSIYNNYVDKKYPEVIAQTDSAAQKFGLNPLSAQLAYLHALGIGRTQKLEPFEAYLQKIVHDYPDDKLITPLVKEHLELIKGNREDLEKREIVLIDFDPNESIFVLEPKPEPVVRQPQQAAIVNQPATKTPVVAPPQITAPVEQPKPQTPAPQNVSQQPAPQPTENQPVVSTPVTTTPPAESIFSMPDAAEYYFVVNVMNPRLNLASSRFGIGQFNRSTYAGVKISHQLESVNRENQLIFVGPFYTKNDVKRYEYLITPLIRDIMKVQPDAYNTFTITKDGLGKLTTREIINTYVDFYKANGK